MSTTDKIIQEERRWNNSGRRQVSCRNVKGDIPTSLPCIVAIAWYVHSSHQITDQGALFISWSQECMHACVRACTHVCVCVCVCMCVCVCSIHGRILVSRYTFLVGECMTGAGGEGGPRGIFVFVLRRAEQEKKSSKNNSGYRNMLRERERERERERLRERERATNLLEAWRLHGVHLAFNHANNPLLCAAVVRHALLCRSVTVKRRKEKKDT